MANFQSALPVWEAGKETEKNHFLVFRAISPQKAGTFLRLAVSTGYQLLVNGELAASGPSRGPHGYYRVDEICLDPFLNREENLIAIIAAGYAVNGYAMLFQPSFLQAELIQGGKAVAATGKAGFSAYQMPQKRRKVQRYSFQRTFCEEYQIDGNYAPMLSDIGWSGSPVPLSQYPQAKLLDRGGVYPDYQPLYPVEISAVGKADRCEPGPYTYYKYISKIGDAIMGFPVEELENFLAEECRGLSFDLSHCTRLMEKRVSLESGGCAILRFPFNATGHLEFTVQTETGCTLYLLFDEILTEGDVDFLRLNCTNAVKYELCPGVHRLISFEPYTMQFLKLCAMDGSCGISQVSLRQVKYPGIRSSLDSDDFQLRQIYSAGVETFCQNAVDLYMDCPHRERAGWLCDSFFTGRVEHDLTGRSTVERSFLENFLLPEHFSGQPEGMFPMCYPSDHFDGRYIPNWAMWLALELEEYLQRTGDGKMIQNYRPKIFQALEWMKAHENSLGLLEMPGAWIFVDSSRSNRLGKDVNYPTNMLYAAMLQTVSRLYGVPELAEKAACLQRKLLDRSYDKEQGFFTDNAIWENGELKNTGEVTESCQYYAFLFGGATPQSHPVLWDRLLTQFGPDRGGEGNPYPQIDGSNAFIGVHLRLETLFRYGQHRQLAEEIKGYFGPMAALTGTIWEKRIPTHSLNHGFGSHVVYWLRRIGA